MKRSAVASVLLAGLVGSNAWALPQGGTVVPGSGSATLGTSGSTLTVNQSSAAVSLNWTHFNVAPGELVDFVQPTNGIALNFVSNPSSILGSLHATGSVFLAAPGGMVIGSSAQVQVGGAFGMSSLPIESFNPLAQQVTFAKVSGTPGQIINKGTITAAGVALLGPSVQNDGTISTPTGGAVVLAAGDRITLQLNAGSPISVSVDQGAAGALARNTGIIQTPGGLALLTARGVDAVSRAVVNNTGVIEANTVSSQHGTIILGSDTSFGDTVVRGQLQAGAGTGVAGDITVRGAKVLYAADSDSRSLHFVTPAEGDVSFGLGVHADLISREQPGGDAAFSINDINYRVIGSADLADLPGFVADGGLTGRYVLAEDVDASAIVGFRPIGSADASFGGIFRGLGHTISSLTIGQGTPQSDVGLFGSVRNAQISDVTLNAAVVSNGDTQGAVVGRSIDSLIDRLAATSVQITGGQTVGGLVGELHGGQLTQSYVTGSVSSAAGSTATGGLVGNLHEGARISESFSMASVTGSTAVGGLVGSMTGAGLRPSIADAYASGAVVGSNRVGGLVGSLGSGTITRTYAIGQVSGASNTGGLVGWRPNGNNTTVSNSYWDRLATQQAMSAGSGAVARTTTTMKLNTGALTFTSFDFTPGTGQWLIYQGLTTPLLTAFLKPLTITSDNITKVYDGQSSALLNPVFSVAGAETSGHLFGLNAPYAGKLDANTTAVPRYAATGLWSDQFGYALTLNTGTLTITRRPVEWVVASKVYNGDAAATVTGISGLIDADVSKVRFGTAPTDNLTVTSALYRDGADAGLAKTVDVGFKYSGVVFNNYQFSTQGKGDITPFVVNLSGSREYNGLSTANAADLSLGTLVAGQTLTLTGVGSVLDPDVGANKAVTTGTLALGDGTGRASNYTLVGGEHTLAITPRILTTRSTAESRVYNGDTNATTYTTLGNVVAGEEALVAAAGTGTFDNKNVGTDKTVTVSGITLSGTGAGNYLLAKGADTNTTKASISPAQLTLTAQADSRSYNGTTSSSVAPVLSGTVFEGDSVTGAGTQSFDNKNVGTGKTLTASAAGITVSDGNEGGNYVINRVDNTQGVITAAQLTLAAQSATKVFDGTTQSPVLPVLLGTVFEGDTVSGQGLQTFDSATIGANKVLTPALASLLINDGNGGANYTIQLTTASGVITSGPQGPIDVDTTPIDTNLPQTGDLLAGLEPTAAGNEEDPEKIKAKYRKDGSPVGVQSGGVKLPPMMR